MKNKKIIMYLIILLIMVIIILVGYYIFNKLKNNNNKFYEFVPEEEITEEQLRQTIITLYFFNANKNELEFETRKRGYSCTHTVQHSFTINYSMITVDFPSSTLYTTM